MPADWQSAADSLPRPARRAEHLRKNPPDVESDQPIARWRVALLARWNVAPAHATYRSHIPRFFAPGAKHRPVQPARVQQLVERWVMSSIVPSRRAIQESRAALKAGYPLLAGSCIQQLSGREKRNQRREKWKRK